MFKKLFSMVFISALLLTTCLAQLPSVVLTDSKAEPKLTRENFLSYQEPAKPDYTKESYKVPPKAAKMSKAAKIGVWSAVIAGAVVLTGFIVWESIKPKNCSIVNDNLMCR